MIKMNLEEAIENLYSTFKKYTTSNMHYCNCGCIDPEDVKKLATKKLRNLEEEDFSSYHSSALYTWGDLEHYKHFLPRILEVHSNQNGRWVNSLYEIVSKLEYAKWSHWPENEIQAIKDFVLVDWLDFVNERESEIGINDLEHYSLFFEINELIELWKIAGVKNGLRNFVHFLYFYGTELMNKGLRIREKVYENILYDFIHQENLLEGLEKEFFRVDEINKEYAEKVSVVIQMIEQERKTLGSNM